MSAPWRQVEHRLVGHHGQDYLGAKPLLENELVEIQWPDGAFSEHRVHVVPETRSGLLLIETAKVCIEHQGEYIVVPLTSLLRAKVRRVANAT